MRAAPAILSSFEEEPLDWLYRVEESFDQERISKKKLGEIMYFWQVETKGYDGIKIKRTM